ncbi:hypothetical protein SMACR_03594 [Sordaria macrospora]|uniref:WGS project CABT00000000 data, contig 2.9 n=2 Tax=Sordaria macrospora TaxID=5147 RepID=F7VVM2_SORMK|nr:uncharacterized protein SMAC_03594 [Sordaria macrospora k-hell]KAA8636118.1 hypothetical protein SMACR_03594 [Sordaria macrospora]KAH7625812.1 hypothetical protein B0T09DRAFT_58314 [Sordaria sp. MPI-SDFR-AT-0083]WPJ65990.1 hypothetical protein SMAC4_03594 [Sordaria macrospora]CCC09563.1 unnamed protein product [Sordaria macrospora k-hell]
MSDLPSSSLRTRRQKTFLRNIRAQPSYTEDDAITPCPIEIEIKSSLDKDDHRPSLSRSSSFSSLRSTRSSSLRSSIEENMMRDYNNIDTQLLWRRMLAIQRTFGCYNSTRMQLAIEMGEQNASVPSRVCLDLLNDSIDNLPSDIKHRIEDFLACEDVSNRHNRSSSSSCRTRRKWSWRHLLHA